jgi:hypothetical protein
MERRKDTKVYTGSSSNLRVLKPFHTTRMISRYENSCYKTASVSYPNFWPKIPHHILIICMTFELRLSCVFLKKNVSTIMLWSFDDNALKNPIRGTRSMHIQDNVLRNIWPTQKDNMDKDSKRDKNNESPNKGCGFVP